MSLLKYYATPDNQTMSNHAINQMQPMKIDNPEQHFYTTDNPHGWYLDLGKTVGGRPEYRKYHVGCTTKPTQPADRQVKGKFSCVQPHWCPHCR